MAEISNRYLPKVGFERPGDLMYIKEDGQFKFFDADYRGDTLRNIMRSHFTYTMQSISNDSLVSGAVGSTSPLFTPCYGYHTIYLDGGCSKASCELQAGSKGDILWIDGYAMVSDASVTFICSVNANLISVFTQRGSRVSEFHLKRSAIQVSASIGMPFMKMVCMEDAKWTIVIADTGVIIEPE